MNCYFRGKPSGRETFHHVDHDCELEWATQSRRIWWKPWTWLRAPRIWFHFRGVQPPANEPQETRVEREDREYRVESATIEAENVQIKLDGGLCPVFSIDGVDRGRLRSFGLSWRVGEVAVLHTTELLP